MSGSGAREIGGYRLVEELGTGGMGAVHLGVSPEGEHVAIKILHPHIASDQAARQRLAREVRTLRRIRHPRVAEVLDAELDAPAPFIVTQFVDGQTLSKDVAENGPFAEDELVHFGHGLLDALRAVHAAGVVHRDLKPANVMIMDGEPMVIDFGIAQAADEVKVTATGLVMGTPGYLSPEIAEGERATEATDWWGWGATMAFAASGTNPFGGGPLEAILGRVARGKANLEGVPQRFVPLIEACLSPAPQDRPDGDAILGALVDIESGRYPRLPGVATPGRAALGAEPPRTAVMPVPPAPQPQPFAPLQGVPRAEHPQWNAGYAPPAQHQPPPRHQLAGQQQGQYPPAPAMNERRPVQAQRTGYGPLGLDQPSAAEQGQLYREPYHAPVPPAPAPVSGSVLALLALVLFSVLAAPLGPFVMLALAYVWSVLARTVGRLARRQRLRQYEAGPQSGWSAAAAAPGAFALSLFTAFFSHILPLIAGLAAAVLIRLDALGAVPIGFSEQFSMWGAAAVFALVFWFGPGSGNLRLGSRLIVRRVAPPPWGHIIVPIVFAVLGLLALSTILAGGSTTWWPFGSNPFDLVPRNWEP
ncbi:serine/threonine-protein kinase [Sediminivirga luteola]|uniref:serine/threonine-protein kinase n=1 Tax=Sediminivirga luteola TaxID=1774748 RepID=UPI00166A8969|nr:serine/threonine-protein kinase [Sediminivirga luteola]MCI2264568.1 serine/threonine protein kinase [Sediminivirga luteola]